MKKAAMLHRWLLSALILISASICISGAALGLNMTLQKTGSTYASSGVWTNRFDSGYPTTLWQNITWVGSEPVNTEILFRLRTAPENASLVSAQWSGYIDTAGAIPGGLTYDSWIEIEVNLSTNDTSKTPLLTNFSVIYRAWAPPLQAENDGTYRTSIQEFNITNISVVPDYIWHRNGKARIRFMGYTNLSGVNNLDPLIEVGHRFAFVNSSAFGNLNKSANITFYGINCSDPLSRRIYYSEIGYSLDDILGSGRLCDDCSNVECANGVNGNLSFTVSHFTGYASGTNANLTIYDEIEDSGTKYIDENVTFFANYTNSGNHISGASCNISFDDNPSIWYPMAEAAQNYNYTKIDGFASAGAHMWNVTCDHASYSQIDTTDTIEITSGIDVPEFSNITLLFGGLVAIFGIIAIGIRRKGDGL